MGAVIGRLPVGLFSIWLCGCLGVLIFVLSQNADAEAEVLPYALAALFLALGLALGGYWYWWRGLRDTAGTEAKPMARKAAPSRQELCSRCMLTCDASVHKSEASKTQAGRLRQGSRQSH